MYQRAAHPHIKVVHHLPDRTRLRLPRGHRRPDNLDSACQALESLPAVHHVEANPSTGSLLLHHDPDPGILSTIAETLEGILGVSLEVGEDGFGDEAGASIVSHLVQGTFSRLDENVSSATSSWLDLKMLVPMALVGAGAARAAESGIGWSNIPAFVFFYYALDTYVKFHRQPGQSPSKTVKRITRR
ncbi:MAG: cation transporter [Candidatus Melainabacteria bacterium]|nr:cation transporter [Candidatus Melainabacteria bacterium]